MCSRRVENAKELAKKLKGEYEVNVYDSVKSAVVSADIICTATSSTEPFIHLQDLSPHVHINAIGSHSRAMREISNETLNQAVVIVDQLES